MQRITNDMSVDYSMNSSSMGFDIHDDSIMSAEEVERGSLLDIEIQRYEKTIT